MADAPARADSLDDIAASLYAELDEEEDERPSSEPDAPAPPAEPDEPDPDDDESDDTPEQTEEVVPAAAEADDGQPRGPDGRFLPKAQPDAAEPPAPAPAAAAAPPTNVPAAPTVPSTPPPPFSVRAGGREHVLEGVTRQADGSLTITADHAARVTNLLQRGVHHETSWRQELAEMQRKLEAKDDETERGRLITRHLMGLLEKGPEAVAEWLDSFEANKDRLLLDIERERLDDQRRALDEGRSHEIEAREAEELGAWLESTIPGEVQQAASAFPGVFEPADVERIANRVRAMSDQIFLIAERDFTASEMAALGYPETGAVSKGERFVRSDLIEAMLREEAAVITRERTRAQEEIRKAKEALAANARNAGGARPVPTAVTAGGGSEPPKHDGAQEPRDMNEWRHSLLAELR